MHEIRTILGNVAAQSEPAIVEFVPATRSRSLTVIGENLSASRGELFPMLLQTGQYREIALVQHRTAVPLYINRARALLLFGSTVLRHGGAGQEKRRKASGKEKRFHDNFSCRKWQ